jgi:hypothetical protein
VCNACIQMLTGTACDANRGIAAAKKSHAAKKQRVLVTAFLGGDSTWKLGEGQSCINSINVRDTSEKLLTLQHPFHRIQTASL